MTAMEIRAAGDKVGYTHPGKCTEIVLDDLEADYPGAGHSAETVDRMAAHSDRDHKCIGCGEHLFV